MRKPIVLLAAAMMASLCWHATNCQQVEILVPVTAIEESPAQRQAEQTNYPYYLQSPFANSPLEQQPGGAVVGGFEQQNMQQRSQLAPGPRHRLVSSARKLQEQVVNGTQLSNINLSPPTGQAANAKSDQQQANSCLYQKRYFARLDECLTRKPYPTIGLPAFKNEDLLVKRGLSEKYGCAFVLNNGLFKNYQISKLELDSDSQCLDNTKVGLSIAFSNVSMAYLWTLRCLNKADQLLEDSTFDGATILESSSKTGNQEQEGKEPKIEAPASICVGSSQSFGFASLQLSGLEAQVELSSDIYKNWRVTNITIGMSPAQSLNAGARNLELEELDAPIVLGSNIKEYVFESLDGDELNWRYLHLFQNWSRNRMHTNFLEQYRRFMWISMQRCLSEASEKLPVKLNNIFASHRFA